MELAALDQIDDVIHQKVRLALMSALTAAASPAGADDEEIDFSTLKAALGVSDGNLATHVAVLEQHGYLAVRKAARQGRRTRTTYALTPLGRQAWRQYVETLDSLLHPHTGGFAPAEKAP